MTKQLPTFNSMEKTRDTRFLKNYTLSFTNTAGHEKIYEIVSNHDHESIDTVGEIVSGVVVVGFRDGKLLLEREFRMGVNRFIYNLPAGHMDAGEDIEACGARELYEETGLRIKKVHDILQPSYASPDLSDSMAYVMICDVEGQIADHTEEDEYIEPVFVSREEAVKLLQTERFSARAQAFTYFFAKLGFVKDRNDVEEQR